MVSFQDVQTAYYMVAATGVLVAAAYYVMNMRNAEKMRKTQVVMSWFSLLQNKEFHRHYRDVLYKYEYANYEEYNKKYGAKVDPDALPTMLALMNQLDYVGFMLREKIADPESIYRIISPTWIVLTWSKLAPVIRGWRETFNDQKNGELAEYLYDETVKRYPRSEEHTSELQSP
jgi:hypothetical protein